MNSQRQNFHVAAALVSVVVGGAALLVGGTKELRAKRTGRSALARYEESQDSIRDDVTVTNADAQAYGEQQLRTMSETVAQFVEFIERNARTVSQSDVDFLDGLDVTISEVEAYRALSLEAAGVLQGIGKAASAGALAYQATWSSVGLFGVAGTGTPIAGLSGAASWNAILAWLGGGSLSTGGGGIALGRIVLGGLSIGSALVVAGFVLNGHGETALTGAKRYAAEVDVHIAEMEAFSDFLAQVRRRVAELFDVLLWLEKRAVASLAELNARPFDADRDAGLFQETALLMKGVVEVVKTPVLDTGGQLNPETARVVARYKKAAEKGAAS